MSDIQPGDLVFCHSKGIIGKAIRLGEWLRWRTGHFYNHVAVVQEQAGTDWTVVQAEARGVTRTSLLSTVAPGGSYLVLRVPNADPMKVVTFAQSQVGKKYGWVSILSIAIRILTPRWLPLPSVRANRTWICSALAAESARFSGWLSDWDDIYSVTPAQLYAAIKGVGVRDVMKIVAQETEVRYGGTSTQATPQKRGVSARKR